MFHSIRCLPHPTRQISIGVFASLVLCVNVPLSAQAITGVTDVEIVARLTGAESMNATDAVGVGGTDLGHMVNHNGRTYFLFGDTFSGANPSIGGNWRSNVMAYSTDGVPANGISFDGWITNSTGMAREVIASGRTTTPPTITEIPTGAISIGNRIYAWYMAVDWWGPPGQWNANYSGLAYWQEDDEEFTVVDDYEFPGSGNFGMVAASLRNDPAGANDEHLYLWGTPAGRLGGVKLARVLPDQVTDHGAYEYFAGMTGNEPTWLTNEFAVGTIIDPTVGEMSVMYNEAAGSWTMLYLNHDAYAIELRQALEPWGPWSDPIQVITGQEAPGLYGSYMNPLYVENDGETIYFTMSLWGPYDVFLVKATLDIVPAPFVELVDVNGGGVSRSKVDSLVVTFSQLVTIDAGAFEVVQRVTGTPVDVTVVAENVGGKTNATLTFSGTPTEYGSLVDGNYQLTIRGDRVRDVLSGMNLDGDDNGTPGGDHLFGDELVENFFRFFGDTDGDRDVDGPDFGRFGLTFRKRLGEDGYDLNLDFDGDDDVDGQDYGQFALRFRKRLTFE